MYYRNESRRLYSAGQISPLSAVCRERNRNTHHELHNIDPKVFFYHSTETDASGPKPVQEVGVRRVDNELDVVLQDTRSNKHSQGVGGK